MDNIISNSITSAISNLWPLVILGFLVVILKEILIKNIKKIRKNEGRAVGLSRKVNERYLNKIEDPKLREAVRRFKSTESDSLAKLEIRPYKPDRNYPEELMDRGEAYTARTHLMSPTERDVFKVLEKAYGDRFHIFCQVRVVDLIQPNVNKYHSNSKEYMSLFRQLSQWHFDYVLCLRDDFKIFCALELDDASHERPDRMRRDRVLNRACEVAGVSLKRMKLNHKEKRIEVI